MIELFKTYVKWKILSHFLANPNTSFHIKQLARILNVSPASVSSAVKSFEENGLLSKEEKGLAHIYRLDSDNSMVAPLKKAYGIASVLSSKPTENFLGIDPGIISLALFGSYAEGSFDEKSDIDFLIVTSTRKEKFIKAAKILEEELEKEVSLSVLKLSEWRAMAKKGDAFYNRIVENHILLHGSGLK
ncbi:MAG: nucleotidyltransferase domain-containing protein [Candidatus Methanoperedens sp.]|nr:nucleotidyltransferase domain-containing protein [Candidatus Methanoperedens sp.]MCZ7406333.1 nucleotidyltransferase domain-containing protein [Candidatus Methanoperedens sp.]